MSLSERLRRGRAEHDAERRRLDRDGDLFLRFRDSEAVDWYKKWGGRLVAADVEEYAHWLYRYMLNGHSPTHYYSHPMPRGTFLRATGDLEVFPFCGASALHILVPEYVNVRWVNRGHNTFYYVRGWTHVGGWVPCYADVESYVGAFE